MPATLDDQLGFVPDAAPAPTLGNKLGFVPDAAKSTPEQQLGFIPDSEAPAPAAQEGDSVWDKIKGAPVKFAVGTAEGLQNVAANIGEGVAQLSDPGPLKNSFGNFLRAQSAALKVPDVSNFNPITNTTTEQDQLARAMGNMELQRETQREQARAPGESFSQAARELADQLSFVKDVTPGPKVAGEAGKTAGETAGMIAPSALPVVGPVTGAAAAGLASTGGTFNEAYKVYRDAGLSEDDAREKARDIAAKTGGTTALLFALPVGKLATMPKTAVSRLMLAAGIGAGQMGADTFQSLLKAQSTYNPNLTLADIAKATGKTAAFGALLSGAMHGVGELGRPGEQPAGAGEQAAPAQPSAEDLAGLQRTLTQNQIKPAAGQAAPEVAPAQPTATPAPRNRVHEAIQEMLKPAEAPQTGAIAPEQAPEAAKTAEESPVQPTAVNEADGLIDASLKRGDISQGEALVMKAQVRVNAAKLPVETGRTEATTAEQAPQTPPLTEPAEGETTESAAPETETGGTARAGNIGDTGKGTPAEKAAPLATESETIPVEGGESPSRSAAGSFSPFKVGDQLLHDGKVKTVTKTSHNPNYVVLDGRMVSVGETRPVPEAAEAVPARRAKLSYTNNRPHDLIDEIEGQHGTIDPTLIKEANPDWKPIGAARKIFKKGGTPADVAADDLSRSGLYKGDPAKVDQFGDAVNDAAQARKGFRATAAREQKQITQDSAFARDVSRPGVDQRTIIADDLQPGDTLKIRGAPFKVREFEFDDDGNVKSVTMDDGAKYGTQVVAGGTEIKYDNRSLRKSGEPVVTRRTPEGTNKQRVAGEGEPGAPRSRDKTIDFLNSLKVDTKGQVHAFGLAPAVWNTLVDSVILGVRGGRKIADAVSWAIDRLKEKYPGVQFDEAGAREHFEKTPVGNLRYESPEGKEVAPAEVMKARREQIDQRLAEISPEAAKAQKTFSKLPPDLRSERFQLTTERRELTKKLLQDPAYVRELILANESKGAEYQAAKATGDTQRARDIAEESLPGAGDVKTELDRVAPELHDQVRKQLEGEGLVKPAPAGADPGRSLGDLTGWLNKNKIDSPKLSLAERLSLSRRLTDTWEKGKDLASRAFHQTMASWAAFKEQYLHPPVDDDVRSLRKDWLYMKQRTGMEVQHWLDAIDSKVPRPDRQMALSIYLDAGRDENLLRAQLDEVPEKWKSVWKAALDLNPKEKELAAQLSVEFSKKLSDGQLVGIIDRGREDYGVPQLWKKSKPPKWETPYDPTDPQFKKQGAPRNLRGSILDTRDPFFALKRKVPSYFDGIMAGGEPESLKIRDLVGVYNAQFHDALADRGYVWAARNAKMPDGSPVVYLSGGVKTEPTGKGGRQYFVDSGWREKDAVTKDGRPYMAVDHPALKGWKFASKDADGNPIMVHGDFMVHPDAFSQLTNDLGQSALRNPNIVGNPAAAAFRFLLNSTVFMKASKFAAATFHGFTLAEHLMTHAFAGKPTADRLSLLNPSVHGVEIDPGKNPDLALLMRNGTYMGFDGQRHLFEEGLASNGGILEHVPYLGDVLKGSTKFVFEYYLPRLKAKLGQVLLDANRERYSKPSMSGPALSDDQIAELTSNQVNAAFGGQHWRLMGTNKTMLDVNRILFTAPDFLLSRAKVVGQALKPYGAEQRAFLIAQVALVYTAARTLNALFSKDHNPHWEPAMWDKVVIGNRAYSGRFLVSDISNAIQDPVTFGAGRIGPWPKTAIDAFVQRDWRTGARMDVPFKTDNRALRAVQIMAKDVGSWMIPVGAEGFLPGAPVKEQSKGSQIAQALAGVGSRKYTAETQMYDAATKFNKSAPDAKTQAYQKARDDASWGESPYRKLTDLIDAGRIEDAKKEYQELLSQGKTAANVTAHYQGIYRPFTGNATREKAFKASLSPADLKVYNEAIQLRAARRDTFKQIRQGVAAPAAAAGADGE